MFLHWEATDGTKSSTFPGKEGKKILLSDIISTEDFALSINLAKTGPIFQIAKPS